jgi:uncharacterized membrane protein
VSLDFIGHLHPLLVHLPIGILLFAVALMVYGRFTKTDVESAVSLAWGLGALSALLACGAGWILAQSGEYDAGLVQVHQWTGLATAGISVLTFLGKRYRPILSTVSIVFLTVAGHYGGNLTHGEDYLFPNQQSTANTITDTIPTQTDELVALRSDLAGRPAQPLVRRSFPYRDNIVPILKTKCYSCHSAQKKKGGLRLDSESFIRQGGKHGSVLAAGNPQKSKLFTYLLLPEDDDRHMPPKGKLQLTSGQVAIIQHWILKGASFTEHVEVIGPDKVPPVPAAFDAIPPLPSSVRIDSANSKRSEAVSVGVEATVLGTPVNAPEPAVLDKLKEQQVTLSKLADGSHYLSANFVNVKTVGPELWDALTKIQPQLVRLRLTNQPVSDADVQRLTSFKNLTRLNLENTRITDAALVTLSTLPNLEQLNLYGTSVTDAGLDALVRYPNLRVVYLWQTQATANGIQRLQKARPSLKIETGSLQLTRPDTHKTMQ